MPNATRTTLCTALLALHLATPGGSQEPTPSEEAAFEAYRMGSFSQAIELYGRALGETDEPSHRARLHVRIAWVLFNDERFEELDSHFRAALDEDPQVTLIRDYYTQDFLDRFEKARQQQPAQSRSPTPVPTAQAEDAATPPPVGPPGYVPRDGLIGWWSLDDSHNGTVLDHSGMGHDATVTNCSLVPGRSGLGLRFDDGGHVTLPSAPPLDQLEEADYTIAAWFMPSAVPESALAGEGQQYAIVVKPGYHEGLTYTWERRFTMQHWLAGNVFKGTFSDAAFEPGSFHHVAGVVDRRRGLTALYVDGRLQRSTSWEPGSAARDFGAATWQLGIADPESTRWQWAARGVVDELGMWNRALPAEEIAALAEGPGGP